MYSTACGNPLSLEVTVDKVVIWLIATSKSRSSDMNDQQKKKYIRFPGIGSETKRIEARDGSVNEGGQTAKTHCSHKLDKLTSRQFRLPNNFFNRVQQRDGGGSPFI